MSTVVTIGETMVLRLLQSPGSTIDSVAGAESNVAIALARLGVTTRWISRVGGDARGDLVLRRLSEEGVDTSFVTVDPDAPTGLLVRDCSDPPTVVYERAGSAASRMSVNDLSVGWLEGAHILHVTGITPALSASCRELIRTAMSDARKSGVLVSFDPNVRPQLWPDPRVASEVLAWMAAMSDIVMPGANELPWIFGEDVSSRDGANRLLDLGAQVVIVKLGPSGAEASTRHDLIHVPGCPVDRVVDPVGAGDAFAAGALAGMLELENPLAPRGDELRRVVLGACAMGAMATTFAGDWEQLPSDRSRLLGLEN